MDIRHGAIAIIPTEDLAASQAFYGRLGFTPTSVYPHEGYCILHDDEGATIHLTRVEAGWVDPARTAFGIYLYSRQVRAIADRLGVVAEAKPWGLVECAVSDPSGTLVRVGWPA